MKNLLENSKSRITTAVALGGLSLGLVCCGQNVNWRSNLDLSSSQARNALQAQLDKTQKISTQIDTIRKALRPVDAALSDLAKAIDLKIDGKPGEQIRSLSHRLDDLLRESVRSVAVIQDDGSWSIRRTENIQLSSQFYDCPAVLVELSGYELKNPEAQDMLLSVQDCKSAAPRDVAELLIDADHRINFRFDPASLNVFAPTQVNVDLDRCQLAARDGVTDLSCAPFKITAKQYTIDVETLRIESRDNKVSADVQLSAYDTVGDRRIGSFGLHAAPGQKPEIRTCLKQSGC